MALLQIRGNFSQFCFCLRVCTLWIWCGCLGNRIHVDLTPACSMRTPNSLSFKSSMPCIRTRSWFLGLPTYLKFSFGCFSNPSFWLVFVNLILFNLFCIVSSITVLIDYFVSSLFSGYFCSRLITTLLLFWLTQILRIRRMFGFNCWMAFITSLLNFVHWGDICKTDLQKNQRFASLLLVVSQEVFNQAGLVEIIDLHCLRCSQTFTT